MPDDLTKRRPQDAKRINVNESYGLGFWSKHIDISPERLKRLVQQHGDSAATIASVLGN